MSIRSSRPAVSMLVVLTCGCARVNGVETAPAPHRSTVRVVAHAVGGAVVGSWAGYFMSQVAWSDWRQEPGRGAQRVRFTIAGGALGLAVGAFIGSRGPHVDLDPTQLRPARPLAATGPITSNEIRASSARTVSELLRSLRPQWLRMRGQDVLRPGGDARAAQGVLVYLNGELLGGLSTLDQVSIDTLTGVEFVEGGTAVVRWGTGNEDGAILLSTEGP
jgi:hypothetical protein